MRKSLFIRLRSYREMKHIKESSGLLVKLFLCSWLAFTAISSASADSGDLPAEVLYRNDSGHSASVLYFPTATEACAHIMEGYIAAGNYTLSDPLGVEDEPGFGDYCSYTYTHPQGYVPPQTVKYQGWFHKVVLCPAGYAMLADGITCRFNSPIKTPKYPIASACDTVGNPIYTAYGNKFQREIDYLGVNNGSPLKLERTYNSTPPLNQYHLQYAPDTLLTRSDRSECTGCITTAECLSSSPMER